MDLIVSLLLALLVFLLFGAGSPPVAPPPPKVTVTGFLGDTTLPQPTSLDGVRVGGLSGIDYDPATGRYFVISDDRSQNGPARFYTAAMDLSAGLAAAGVTTTPMLRPDGTPFPALGVDPEAVRFDPATGTLYWTSEGERIVPATGTPTLTDPFLREMTTAGAFVREFGLPADEKMTAGPQGPRQNQVLEGVTLTADGTQLLTSMEGPLLQDGPAPTTTTGAPTRMTFLDRGTGQPTRQIVYPLDPIYAAPVPADQFAVTGVVDVLAVDADRYLVMERSFSVGVGNRVRIYEMSTAGASDVLGTGTLVGADYTPVTKRLVLDLADLPLVGDGTIDCANGGCVDNVEGMTLGPVLPDGRRTLVMVSDDNFTATQRTQFIAVSVSLR